jgi:hypothetical protein
MISEEVCVDYSTPYFLNAPQPLIGSSDLSTEWSADGTLSKTTVKLEDSTFEKLLDVLPAGKLVESITGLTGKPTPVEDVQAAKPAGQIRYEFDITAGQHYIRHTLFQEVERRDFRSPISPSDDKSWYRREFVASLQPEETEQETTPPSGDTEADE